MIHLLRADYFISYLPDTGSRFSLDMSLMDYCSCHLSDHMATHFWYHHNLTTNITNSIWHQAFLYKQHIIHSQLHTLDKVLLIVFLFDKTITSSVLVMLF